MYEIALNYADAEHRGDKRKKSQQCFFDAVCNMFSFNTFLSSKM